IMGIHAMLLVKHSAARKGRIHGGKGTIMRSNPRWCSDGVEFTCWICEVVRLAVIVEAAGRGMFAWPAVANAGVSGSDVRDMMLEGGRETLRRNKRPACYRTSRRQWFCFYSARHKAVCPGAQSDALLYPCRKPQVERHVRGFRQNPEARL